MESNIKKHIFSTKLKARTEIFNKFCSMFGLPKINIITSYFSKQADRIVEIEFKNNGCSLRSYYKNTPFKKYFKSYISSPYININNKRIKYLLMFLNELGINRAYIGQIIEYSFIDTDNIGILFRVDTFIGDTLIAWGNNNLSIIQKFIRKEITEDDIDKIIRNKKLSQSNIFGGSDILNLKLTMHAGKFGIDVSPFILSLGERIDNKSNNYSVYIKPFRLLTSRNLIATNYIKNNSEIIRGFFRPVSVIIPSYNSEDTILHTLYSIESQNLTAIDKEKIEVIIIDDGSAIRVADVIKEHKKNFTYKLLIVRHEENQGLSMARNTGIAMATHENLLFLDSDIIMAHNYLYEHSIRLQTIPNALFFSLKKNIGRNSKYFDLESVKKGVVVPTDYNDKRLYRDLNQGSFYKNIFSVGNRLPKPYEAIESTNMLMDFGYGRKIYGNSLPSMVVGHNMSISKTIAEGVHGFSNRFIGWGLEDTYFGAKVFDNGNFIIPVLTSGVYHIEHLPRLGAQKNKKRELEENIRTYKELLNQE